AELVDSTANLEAEGLDPLRLRLVTWNDTGRQDPAIWTSHDSGQTWTRSPIPIRRSFFGVEFVDSSTAWVLDESPRGMLPEISWTSDGGRTWTDLGAVATPDDFTFGSLKFVTRDLGFLAAYDTANNLTNFRTTDGGETWVPLQLPAAPP